MSNIKFLYNYIIYKLSAKHKHGHGIHSPFVFDLVVNVIKDKVCYNGFEEIEALREELLKSEWEISVKDFGGGSNIYKSNLRKVKNIVKYSSIKKKYGQLLFRLVNYFKPGTIVELGTSLGISSTYLALPNKMAKVFTIEGCPETARMAQKNFETLGIENITINIGEFENELPKVLNQIQQNHFVFFDGHHKKGPTLSYFEQCLLKISNESLFVFDDIHLSKEMEEAWNEIKCHPKTKVTIDLFFLGIVFFKKELQKQHFIIRF